ncbi:basement membrane-specific heparan sulfate proteoglycan core protein-like [Mytilus edulis]|uniref:basement membrane-specific heparan sulfate proteoglycan core protein-like n=1 Tax=Mytilus edulis TaxID=6550 RepID=UPI0039EF1927
MGIKNIQVVIVLFSLIGIETIGVQIQATPSEGIIGSTSLQLRCSYTAVTGEFVTGANIQAKISGQFQNIATFYTPSLPFNASLTTEGNYLTNRVTLANPTSLSTDSALMQFFQIECEDETEYMCQVAYTSAGGSTSADSGVANISVKGNPERPDSVPSYVPSAGIEEGHNVVFTCTSNVGKPAGKFRWVRYRRNSNGDTLQTTPYDSETTTATLMPGTCTSNGTSSLTLKMEQIDNNVVVRCQVVYQDVPQGSLYKQTLGVNVFYSVRNVQVTKFPSNPTFAEGAEPITLTCTSAGNPAVINTGYTWYKESRTSVSLGTGSTYVINNVVVNETDNYICVAQNSFNGQTFNTNNSIHVQIDLTTTTSTTMPTTKMETSSTNHKTFSIEKEKECSTDLNSILIAVVAVLSGLQLAEMTGLYILHKKGIVQFKIAKKEIVYADVKSDNTQVHIYSTMNRAEDSGNSNYYNEIH